VRYRTTIFLLLAPCALESAVAQCPTELAQQVFSSYAGDRRFFGESVDVWGRWAAVGAPGHVAGGSGSVHVFRRDGGEWLEVQVLRVSDKGDLFGTSVSLWEGTLVVGGAGVRVFELTGAGRFCQVAQFGAELYPHRLGGPVVDLWRDTLVVGFNPPRIYGRDVGGAGSWGLVKEVETGIALATSVALYEDALLVGHPSDGEGAKNSGAGYVFERDRGGSEAWGFAQKLKPPMPTSYTYLGYSVAMWGDHVLLGSPKQSLFIGVGSVHAFQRPGPGGVWSHVQTLTEPSPWFESSGSYSRALALSADVAVVGAPEFTSGQSAREGRVFVYALDDAGSWVRQKELELPQSSERGAFGRAVSTHAGTVVGGAPFDDRLGYLAGSAGFGETVVEPVFSRYCVPGESKNKCSAQLCASGRPSANRPSGFEVTAWGSSAGSNGQYFFGVNGRVALAWSGSSTLCVRSPVRRCGKLKGSGSFNCRGTFRQDLNALWAANPAKNPGAGAVVQLQLWVRDVGSPFSPDSVLSDALEFALGP
jgi:hypothetical protein